MNHKYNINKGVNRPLEFKGLKAQYIAYLAAGLLALLLLFAILYFIGLPTVVCLLVIISSGTALFVFVMRYSSKYGEHGLMKEAARRKTPNCLRSRKKRPLNLNKNKTTNSWK